MVAVEEKAISLIKNETVNTVMSQIQAYQTQGRLQLPPGYSVQNALMSAWLTLQTVVDKDKRPALQVCTKDSIANSLLDMVVQGLNPMKKQCYFIVYGNQLTLQRSYHGTRAVTKTLTRCKDIFAEVVYEGDVFKYRILGGKKQVVEHTQELSNVDKKKIKAAYCTIVPEEGEPATEIMTVEQIHQAWAQSRQSPFDDQGNLRPGTVHWKFPEEMAKKTVTNRACKMFINMSNDDNLVVDHMKRADDEMEEAELDDDITSNANGQVLDVEFVEKPSTGEETMPAADTKTEAATAPGDNEGQGPAQPKQDQKASARPRKDRGF